MRIVLVVLGVVLIACGSESSPTVAPSAAVGVPPPPAPSSSGLAPPAAADASSDAAVCVTPEVTTDLLSDECDIFDRVCPTCAEGWQYKCKAGQPRVRHDIAEDERLPGCRKFAFDNASATSRYCCQPACVRSKGNDLRCTSVEGDVYPNAFDCPRGADGVNVVANPSGCAPLAPVKDEPFQVFCCP